MHKRFNNCDAFLTEKKEELMVVEWSKEMEYYLSSLIGDNHLHHAYGMRLPLLYKC